MIRPDCMQPRVRDILRHSLLNPTADFLTRPGKRFRARLVELGARLVQPDGQLKEAELKRCEIGGAVIESIHAGALIIDDIQDNSQVRRNQPTLHLQYGVARALNAGNWLYFSPLNKLRDMELDPVDELHLFRDCIETLTDAHCGQALDLGMPIDQIPQPEVHSVCMSSLELKTGALMGLALRMGGYAAGASREQKESLSQFGNRLGIGLQMFDDAGNFAMDCGSEMSPKKHEDLHLRRPSWLWAFIADQYNTDDFERWKQAVSALPDETALLDWCRDKNFIDRIRLGARAHLELTLKQMESKFVCHGLILKEARQFIKDLETAYV